MAGPLAMRVEVEGFDPIEQTIARGIVKAMGEDGLNPEKARLVGRCVAEAVAAYRRPVLDPTDELSAAARLANEVRASTRETVKLMKDQRHA